MAMPANIDERKSLIISQWISIGKDKSITIKVQSFYVGDGQYGLHDLETHIVP